MFYDVLETKPDQHWVTGSDCFLAKSQKRGSHNESNARRVVHGVRRPEARRSTKTSWADGRVLVRIAATGVTPLDHTILSGRLRTSDGRPQGP
jgi:hypothetical protein